MQDNTTKVDTKTHVPHPAMILVIFLLLTLALESFIAKHYNTLFYLFGLV